MTKVEKHLAFNSVNEFLFVYNLKSQELNLDNYFTKNFPGRASVFTSTLGILSEFGTSSGPDR